MLNIELLTEKNFTPTSLDSFKRTQTVKKVYRRQNGKYALVDMPYTEDWTLERKRKEAQFLRSSECIAYLALENNIVAGFTSLKKQLYGSYMILDMMHVSADYRGKGIGRQLFNCAKEEAKKIWRNFPVYFRLFSRRNNSFLQSDGRRNYGKSNKGIYRSRTVRPSDDMQTIKKRQQNHRFSVHITLQTLKEN